MSISTHVLQFTMNGLSPTVHRYAATVKLETKRNSQNIKIKMALEYWREQWKTMDDGRVHNGILITKSSNCADQRKARAPNASECTALNDKITRVGSCEKRGEHDKKSSPRGSHPSADAARQQKA